MSNKITSEFKEWDFIRMSRILIIENHGELFRLGRYFFVKIYSDFEKLLKKNGYQLRNFNRGMITNFDLKEYNIVIIGEPQRRIYQEEIQAVKDFVSNGGGLLLIGGAGNNPLLLSECQYSVELENFNRLANDFGIGFGYTLLVGGENSLYKASIVSSSFSPYPIITKFLPHPVVQNINELVIYNGVPIRVKEEWQSLAISDSDTSPPNSIVLAATQYGKGKIVAISTSKVFVRKSFMKIKFYFGLYRKPHRILLTNIINWLSQD